MKILKTENKDIRDDLIIQLSRLEVFVKPQFTLVNEDFTKTT